MLQVTFLPAVDDAQLLFAVTAAQHNGRWVFCRHRARTNWELPGGHREPGESIEQAARRELIEETGARDYALMPVGPYSVADGERFTCGMLYAARIRSFDPLPAFEMAEISLFETHALPSAWTYPQIHPLLLEQAAPFFSGCDGPNF